MLLNYGVRRLEFLCTRFVFFTYYINYQQLNVNCQL